MSEFRPKGIIGHLTWFCLENKLVVFLLLIAAIGYGLFVAPFDWKLGVNRDPVPVDAIPDIGENQQIVFTEWRGRSPRDIQDQVTYPLTTSLLGIPNVKTVRSYAYFGFTSIYVIFDESVDFYWSRSRILEKLNSLPPGTLPEDVTPMLGPDATALGQIFWYTLEGRDPDGNPTGGWDPHELRSIQDFYVRYSLLGSEGVAEVASVGGFVQEYQIDVDPKAMRAHNVTLPEVFRAVQNANRDVGARNLEINNVEYFIRGLGLVKSIEDLEYAVVKTNDNVPLYVKDVALVTLGPAQRRGILDKGGAEVVGGVVVARFGANPLAVIKNVKERIAEISPGLPEKILPDGTRSKLAIVPFYDRTGLIHETLDTLKEALSHEILVTVIIILVMLMNLRSSILVSCLLPLSVLITFIAMKRTGVNADIVALSGIAIAIGTMVDMGIVMVENIIQHLEKAPPEQPSRITIYKAATEVGGAVVTAVATTVIGFLPVFTMEAAEGKLFRPLAFTKTYALMAAILVSLVLIPPLADRLLGRRKPFVGKLRILVETLGVLVGFAVTWWLGLIILAQITWLRFNNRLPEPFRKWIPRTVNILAALAVTLYLSATWMPLGIERGLTVNVLFVLTAIGLILLFFQSFQWTYPQLMRWALAHRALFLSIPALVVLLGVTIWLGFHTTFGWLPQSWKNNPRISKIAHAFPGLGKEFMPPLDEGSYLYMPTTSVHAAINEAADVLRKQDMGFAGIPEVAGSVGKLGRAETPLDPAPISMIETVINYHPEFLRDENGRRVAYRFNSDEDDYFRDVHGNEIHAPDGLPYKVRGTFARDDEGRLIPDKTGRPFRLWRPPLDPELNPNRKPWPGIRSPDDIWDEIVRVGKMPGTTSAPKLQPIAARLVMLQSGMRAPMGIKVKGPDLETIEAFGLELERLVKQVPGVEPTAVIADRIIGKPYLEFHIDRKAIARYGIKLDEVQSVIEVAIGGKTITTTVEG
nr:efflux RND transporter permease subunit [Acidobacteriota bacterium]